MSCTDLIGRRGALAAALLAGFAVASCNKAGSSQKPQTITVTMEQMAFQPANVDALVGDTIRWVNKDLFQHTATAGDQSFDVDLKPGETAKTTLGKPGTIKVTCRYHPGMIATLRVL